LLELEPKVDAQISLFPSVPSETRPEKSGAVYTPQFIASFFAKYIRDNMTPRAFRTLRFFDPACGSGIFARTLLEQQCDPVGERVSPQAIAGHFERIRLVDSNPGACEAARRSLSLLYLILTGSIPRAINIKCADAIRLWTSGDRETYNVIIVNPPYIKYEHLTPDDREHYQKFCIDGTHWESRFLSSVCEAMPEFD
jgi:methylase of polypeptide subunit release factors